MNDPIPELMLEKLALGELSDSQSRAIRAQLDTEGDDRLAALEASNARILDEHPPARVAADIHRRLAQLEVEPMRRPAGGGWMVWAPVAAAAGLALVWWVTRDGEPTIPGGDGPDVIALADGPATPPTQRSPDDGAPERIYLKGDPRLMVDRIDEGRLARMDSTTQVASGDRLQLAYSAGDASQGVIVSIDGAGVATLHFPEIPGDATGLDHGGRISLRTSYELDQAPAFERFFFVTVDAERPALTTATVMDAARALAAGPHATDGALALPDTMRQQSLLLRK